MKFTTQTEYVRSLKATNSDGKIETSFISQPYALGMYVIIDGRSDLQLNLPHKKFQSWVKGSIKKMEANGRKVEVTKGKLGDFLSKEDIDNYIND